MYITFLFSHGINLYWLIFFFSSRRRHTRWTGDWSSDVCSSDLPRQQKPKTLTTEQIETLIAACENLRDTLLLRLLYESSLRIGECLALWIEDLDIERCQIAVRDRGQLENRAEIKTPAACRRVDVSRELINHILDYL